MSIQLAPVCASKQGAFGVGAVEPIWAGFLSHGRILLPIGAKQYVLPIISTFYTTLSRGTPPKNVTDEERKGACKKAKSVIGEQYDVDFKFDIEEELKYYTGTHKEDAKEDLYESQKHIKKFDHAFSCTELVSYSWWHKREDLRLYRKKRRGKSVIVADDFLNGGWDIRWLSKSVTPDMANKFNLHEEGLSMIEEYWANR